jgi:uncharacterized protein (TIGR00730 family)
MRVCVFAASSSRIDRRYSDAASELGKLLADEGMEVIYGGGGIGLMGKIADAVIAAGGKVTGVIPGFMELEGWGHKAITEMIVTNDMNERKRRMFSLSDAVIALPGGVGTLEELSEAITLKQLGLFRGPVIILNTLDYYRDFLKFLDHMIKDSFLRTEHKNIWEVVDTPHEAISSLKNYDGWLDDPRSIAKIY